MIHSSLTRALLYAPAKLYELGVQARIALYRRGFFRTNKLNAPVISVGNLTVGGTGKTPCVAFLANFLRGEGHEVAILSRGYKRDSTGRIEVSNGKEVLSSPRESGDEPYLLARSCPGVRVVVDRNRYTAGRWLEERTGVSIFVLDDGFQHLQLARDLNLLLIDAREPLDLVELVPFGRLREPLTGIGRADAVIVTHANRPLNRNDLENKISRFSREETPYFYAHHQMSRLRRLDQEGEICVSTFASRPVAAISGIAQPEGFIANLSRLGMRVLLRRDFPDHHRYTNEEVLEVARKARSAGAQAIITTEKDAANLPAESLNSSGLPVYAAQIEFHCEEEEALKSLLRSIFLNRS